MSWIEALKGAGAASEAGSATSAISKVADAAQMVSAIKGAAGEVQMPQSSSMQNVSQPSYAESPSRMNGSVMQSSYNANSGPMSQEERYRLMMSLRG